MTPRRIHTLIALLLLVCVICPFAEMILHSNSCIFVTGHDSESTVAFLILVAELAFALGKALVLLPNLMEKLVVVAFSRTLHRALSVCLPEISPPTPLRI